VLHHSSYTCFHVTMSCFVKQEYDMAQVKLEGDDNRSEYVINGPSGEFTSATATRKDCHVNIECRRMGEGESSCDIVHAR
jgi:hypothetical protein